MDLIVSAAVGKAFDCLYDATFRHFGYLYHYKANIERLRNEAEKLADTREIVQAKIDEATTKGEIILRHVRKWTERVDDVTVEAGEFREKEDEANKRCLKGFCIDPCSRYRVSKEAEWKTLAILDLKEEGKFERVSRHAPPSRIIISSALSVNFRSRELITNQIMESLKDRNVSIIGICGMGGVGKTTLVKEISKQAINNDLFDRVAMAVVSQTQSYVKIQGEIASMLGFMLPDSDELARARFLWQKIIEKEKPGRKQKQERKQEPERQPKCQWICNLKRKQEKELTQEQKPELETVLIILDDVWEGIELERIGIPFGKNFEGCKIVLTSRNADVCIKMNAKTFTVGTLPKEESWSLFCDVAGGIVDDADINPIAREVADECCGLPIAIVIIAGALKNRKNKHVWIDAARQLQMSNPTNIEEVDEKVLKSLELSYNYLRSEEVKSVFLLCCLFPEDFNISVELLMTYAMGLRLFQEVETVEQARGRTYAAVSTLVSSFLLMTGDDEKHVKMHDVVRYVAIKLSKVKDTVMAKAGIGLRKWPRTDSTENFSKISLMYNDILEVHDKLEYSKLQALLLQKNSSLVVSDNFFEGMKDLKVLDMSCIHKLPLPSSIQFLINLTTLCLNNCIFGEAGISLIGKLTNLEILSLKDTDVAEIPENFEQLVKLRFLDMRACFNLRRIPDTVISCFGKLEELYISNSIGYRRLFIELQNFSRLTTFCICTQEARLANSLANAILANQMFFQKPTSFDVEICFRRSSFRPLEKCTSWSRILFMANLHFQPDDLACPAITKVTEVLQLYGIVGLRNVLPDLGNHGFNDLKFLQLSHCREITHLFDMLEPIQFIGFNSLESLKMAHIPNLVEICHGRLPDESFCKLKEMYLSDCHKMLTIVPSNFLQRLCSLEVFEARSCSSVEYVFDFERLVIAEGETKLLASLQNLSLLTLCNMRQIWKGDAKLISLCNLDRLSLSTCSNLRLVFPPDLLPSLISLQHVEISDCNNLEEIFGKEEEERDNQQNEIVALKIHHTTTSPSLGNLTTIRISYCLKLKNLFTPSVAKCLVQLTTLEVEHCRTMEEIVSDEKAEPGASTERITFPSLYRIGLEGLDSLTCFSAVRSTIEFSALELLDIQGCPRMETFGRGEQLTPNLNNFRLGYQEFWTDNLNVFLQEFMQCSRDLDVGESMEETTARTVFVSARKKGRLTS